MNISRLVIIIKHTTITVRMSFYYVWFVREGAPGFADDDYTRSYRYDNFEDCLKAFKTSSRDPYERFNYVRNVHGALITNDKYFVTNGGFGNGINNSNYKQFVDGMTELESIDDFREKLRG